MMPKKKKRLGKHSGQENLRNYIENSDPKTTRKNKVPIEHRRLTMLQENFVQAFATGKYTVKEAALIAGIKPNNAHSYGTQLIDGRRWPNVVKRLQELRDKHGERNNITFDTHVAKLAEIRDAAFEKEQYSTAVTAEKARGQAAGLYVERKEILTGKIEQMSREDVIKKIMQLQKEYPALGTMSGLAIEQAVDDIQDRSSDSSKPSDDILEGEFSSDSS